MFIAFRRLHFVHFLFEFSKMINHSCGRVWWVSEWVSGWVGVCVVCTSDVHRACDIARFDDAKCNPKPKQIWRNEWRTARNEWIDQKFKRKKKKIKIKYDTSGLTCGFKLGIFFCILHFTFFKRLIVFFLQFVVMIGWLVGCLVGWRKADGRRGYSTVVRCDLFIELR